MTDNTRSEPQVSMDPRRLPSPYLWGLGIGLVGLAISFDMTSSTSINGVTTCSSSDLAAFVFAAVCLLTAADGAKKHRAQRVQERTATRWMAWAFTGALALLAVVHVLRGFGFVGGPC